VQKLDLKTAVGMNISGGVGGSGGRRKKREGGAEREEYD
jgi:hypothetical protein